MKKRPIVIQGALQSEIDLLLERMSLDTKREIGGVVFYEGVYRDHPVAVCKTKMGEIAAAIATTVAIDAYDPAWIINQGTAGAFARDLRTGDVVIGEQVVYLSQYATREDKEGDDLNPWKTGEYRTLDGERASLKTDERLLAWLRSLSLPVPSALRFGALGSGDVWTTGAEKIDAYHARFGILCEAMECTGAYMAASLRGVPCVSVRVISNNELLGEVYRPESAEIAARCAIAMLDAWIDAKDCLPF